MNQKLIDQTIFRPARKDEGRKIAELFSIASDGVAEYIWTTYAEPSQDIFEFGAARYSEEDTPFSYINSVMAELNGEVLGMLLAFPMQESEIEESEIDPVLLPYTKLEQYGSYYICAMAVFDEFRGMGTGTKLLEIAERQAIERELPQLSLLVFEQNEGAVRLYEQNGFYETKREQVVPHELIHYTGDVLLMVKDID